MPGSSPAAKAATTLRSMVRSGDLNPPRSEVSDDNNGEDMPPGLPTSKPLEDRGLQQVAPPAPVPRVSRGESVIDVVDAVNKDTRGT
ncbi:hypothetical protein OPT61_g3767 [Boeremia exigua]|uniref:Uncharacterized protein n=1 Tax=Boeremia exigua TaxID=749465 RepID=A0ACC2IGS0_9PLEO|nr:hypothetical protein OPT61_g3767 [Boeremia exigua]